MDRVCGDLRRFSAWLLPSSRRAHSGAPTCLWSIKANGVREMRLWLIDAGYMINAQRSIRSKFNLDYFRLRRKLEESGTIWRAYYLNSTPHPRTDAQDGFHSWLRSAPPRGPQLITKLYGLKDVRVHRAYCIDCETKVSLSCPHGEQHRIRYQQQKGVYVGIATLALMHRDRYDTLLLSSGDGDLIDAIEFLSEQGKRLELAVFREGVATDLQARADKIYWINDFAAKVNRDDEAT